VSGVCSTFRPADLSLDGHPFHSFCPFFKEIELLEGAAHVVWSAEVLRSRIAAIASQDLDSSIALSLESHRHLRVSINVSIVGEFATIPLTCSFVIRFSAIPSSLAIIWWSFQFGFCFSLPVLSARLPSAIFTTIA
jgi:hypothetical protein